MRVRPEQPKLEVSPEGVIMGWLCPPSNHIACYKGASAGKAPPPLKPPTTTDAVGSLVESAVRKDHQFGFEDTLLTRDTSINGNTHDPKKKKSILGG